MNNNKPLILTIEDFKIEAEQAINGLLQKYQLPIYFIEPFFTNVAKSIQIQAQQELKMAREQYEKEVDKKDDSGS